MFKILVVKHEISLKRYLPAADSAAVLELLVVVGTLSQLKNYFRSVFSQSITL